MWNTLIITPLSSVLHFFLTHFGDVGLAIVFFTIFIKILLFPLNLSAAKTTKGMKLVQKEVEKLREKHKSSPQELGRELSKLYKDNGIKPFSSILNLFIQIPIVFGLYTIIKHEIGAVGGAYMFSYIDVSQKSLLLAGLAFISMFILMQISAKDMANTDEMKDGFQKDFAKMMAIQMKYFMPVLILLSTTFLPAGLTLYFVVANVFGIFQTLLIRKLVHKTN